VLLIFLRIFFDTNKESSLKRKDMKTIERVEKHSLKVNWQIREFSDWLAKSGATIGSAARAGYAKVSMDS